MATSPRPASPVHLPPQPTRLIGREDELAFSVTSSPRTTCACDFIDPGGAGKTRLAIAAAEQVVERFPDGVWFVDLAP